MVDISRQTLILPSETNSLVIETGEDHWANCFLLGAERTYLGADDLTVIFIRLRKLLSHWDRLDSPVEEVFEREIEGFPVFWLLSLAEAHHVLYVAVSGEDSLLFWQNAHRSPVTITGTMRLTPSDRQQWQKQLDTFLPEPLLAVNGHRQFISEVDESLTVEALK